MFALDIATTTSPVDDLRRALRGRVVAPGDDGWDAARSAWNLAVDQRPVAVVTPVDEADVIAAVHVALSTGLRIAPQSSGHNVASIPSLDGTIIVRTTELKGVEIDADRRIARARAGSEWRDVTGPAAAFGLAPLSGSSPQVGVVGYTLGGGISWLARKHGLAADAVVAIELVTADGVLRRVDADHCPDLFWALRGGGGNFGIVTAIEFRLFAHPTVVAGMLLWPAHRAPTVLPAWTAVTRDAPDELTTALRLLQLPPDPALPEFLRGGSFVAVDGAYAGDDVAAADALLAPLRALEPMLDTFAPVTPDALGTIHMDPEAPMPLMGDTIMLDALPDEAGDAFLRLLAPDIGSPFVVAELRHIGGALAREHAGQGARGAIAGQYLLFLCGVPVDAHVIAAIEARAERVRAALGPWESRASYLNFVEHAVDPAGLFEAPAYARLREIRTDADPTELFLANHAIPPARPS
jgi:FAD/FMN-containing dehydrogenase